MASVFGITSSDIQKKIAPINADQVFTISNSEQLSDADCLSIIEKAEDQLKTNLDPKYRRSLTKIDGEILTDYASSNQTAFQTSFYPISNLKLYIDFKVKYVSSGLSIAQVGWERRNSSHVASSSLYTANTSTGAITFTTGLVESQTLYAEYDHTYASNFLYLKDIVCTLAAIEISRRFYFNINDSSNRFLEWEEMVNKDLAKLRFRDIGVPQIDNINFVYGDTDKDFYLKLFNV